MTKLLTIATLVAALAPATAGATTTQELTSALASGDAAGRYEIVDIVTRRPIAVLVPVAGPPGTLRLIGARPDAAVPDVPAAPPAPLSPDQVREQMQREIDATFHVEHNP